MAASKNACHQVWTDGEDRPRCSKHGQPMHKGGIQDNAQKWCCSVLRKSKQNFLRKMPPKFPERPTCFPVRRGGRVLCCLHGCSMLWNKDPRKKRGGYPIC